MPRKDKERGRIYQREWQRRNREKTKQYREKYLAENREKELARQREVKRIWAAKNPELKKQRALEYYIKHKDKRLSENWLWRQERKRDPEKERAYAYQKHLREKYGMSPEDYEAMVAKQGGICAACGKPPRDKTKKLHVDHDHVT